MGLLKEVFVEPAIDGVDGLEVNGVSLCVEMILLGIEFFVGFTAKVGGLSLRNP